jgi:hypothetical protein
MKNIAGYVTGAVLLALLGSASLAAGMLERQIARTQQSFAAQKYDEPNETFESIEHYLEYASWLPWIGSGPLNDVRARRAAMQYWQHQYDLVAPAQQGDPVAAIAPDNEALQLIVANAVYRKNQPGAKDRATTLKALDAAINSYLTVLKNARRYETAAYNYEYVVRAREDVEKGRRAPELTDTAEDGPAGRQGGPPPQDSNKRDFKILIPLEPGEMDKAIEPGKGAPIERKG